MKKFLDSGDGASKGAALLIVIAMVVLLAGVCLAYFSRTTTERQLAQSSYSDTNADLLARSALDIVVSDFKQEILNNPTVTQANIQPTRYGDAAIPNLIRRSFSGDPTNRTSNVSSGATSANGRSISTARWNSHYLVPRLNTGTQIDSTPISSFIAPDWVLVTAQGPAPAPAPGAVIGRYAFAVYDEGGLLDMTLAGYPQGSPSSGWSSQPTGTCSPMPTPWLLNVGRKGIVTMADLTALPFTGPTPQSQVDKIVGWRNYGTTLQAFASPTPFSGFPSSPPSFTTDCEAQTAFGDYVLDFGEPAFEIDSIADVLTGSTDPLTSVAPNPIPSAAPRTDQAFKTRQELLKLRSSLDFSQNVLQYMGTFSRERNRPAPDWPGLNGVLNVLTERWNINNLDLLKPNPCGGTCVKCKRKKKVVKCAAAKPKKGRGRKCGDGAEILRTFGLVWSVEHLHGTSGQWIYIGQGYTPSGGNNPCAVGFTYPDIKTVPIKIMPVTGSASAPHQNDFFQILHFALHGQTGQVAGGDSVSTPQGLARLQKTFAVGASLIDQYDSDDTDLDVGGSPTPNPDKQTHTTIICFAGDCDPGKPDHDHPRTQVAFGMETSDINRDSPLHLPERPDKAPNPGTTPNPSIKVVLNQGFTGVGEFGFGIDTSQTLAADRVNCTEAMCPTLKFYQAYNATTNQDPRMLDFFSYNPVSSAYPRAGIVNLNTRNAPVLAAILQKTILLDATPTPEPVATAPPIPSPTPPSTSNTISSSAALNAAQAIVNETSVRPALTRADVSRLVAVAGGYIDSDSSHWQQREAIVRALAEIGGTRSWSLLIDVIAQTGKYAPGATDVTDGTKFVVEGEKRFWLHIALGRDLKPDGTADVLGTQLEEVVE